MEDILSLFLVAPKGYEEKATVIAAPDKETAKKKINNLPDIKELTDMGVKLKVVDITLGLAVQGYNVVVTRMGMFH